MKNTSPLEIRVSLPEDAPYLTRWLSEPEILAWFPMINALEIEDAVKVWIGYAKYGANLTVVQDGDPCGMANLYLQPYKKLSHQCLFSIIVAKEKRGQGIGSFLLEELIKLAKERFHIELLHLEVYDGNPARKLYERFGFTPFGAQTHFIKEGGEYRAKIMMQKQL
jgi:RimJ/RimL family protein N-acetyltransferase